MRIASFELKQKTDGLSEFIMDDLGSVVVLVGENGSGKTRLMKLLEKTLREKKVHDVICELTFANDNGESFELKDKNDLHILNYSHSDLPLQSARYFPPHVIDVSYENLHKPGCVFEQTAREALLYLTRLTKYSPEYELDNFNDNYCIPLLGKPLEAVGDRKEPSLFGYKLNDLEKVPLSPGQKYLIRLCVALNCNLIPKGSILFLDEPESHLHPKAMIKLVDTLKSNFEIGQIWIATHSVELISVFWYTDIWFMNNGL